MNSIQFVNAASVSDLDRSFNEYLGFIYMNYY